MSHWVVAQLSDDGVVAITGVVGIGRCTLHRRNTGWCAQLAVVVLALFLYLHHAGSIVFLACRNVVAADAVNITKLAYAEFTCYAFVADEVMLGKAVLRYGDNRGRDRWCNLPFRGTSVQAESKPSSLVLPRCSLKSTQSEVIPCGAPFTYTPSRPP